MVLNACQSGMLDTKAGDAFATVATALLQSGMRSVVAMAYALYVSGAQVFLPAFYQRLFEAGSVAEAVRAGRQEMLAHKDRVCARGRYPLEDWLLPVLYQQEPFDFGFAKKAKPAKVEARESRLPQDVRDHRDAYGFIGRDGPILEMERALHRKAPAILVQGLGGVGKTTLARGFLRWLDDTGGLDGALWFDFRDIRSAEYVINRTGEAFCGENFGIAPNKLGLLARALGERRVVMVWDNFESATANLTVEDRAELGRFLDAIRGGRGKAIVTSRSREEWLKPEWQFELSLPGLDGEERWEYCETILRELGLKVNRDDPELSKLMDQLAGHPLAMRVVLPKLEGMPAAKIAEALRTNIAELGLNEQEASIRLVEQGLPDELRPLLPLIGLHESYVTAWLLEPMAKQVDASWTRERIDQLMAALGLAGLVWHIGETTYEMHPLLTSFLRSHGQAPESLQRAFVDAMGSIAQDLTSRELHEQRVPFLLHSGNFRFALDLAERLSIDVAAGALTQSLAAYALNSRSFVDASRLFIRLAENRVKCGDAKGEAAAYHQLGCVGEEQRTFGAARAWLLKSIAINEQLGELPTLASSYHVLGSIALAQRELSAAREWFLKSLAINERQGNRGVVALTYHQLGVIAQHEGDFAMAQQWYLKSAAGADRHRWLAGTYYQLGVVARRQGDLQTAKQWLHKSLDISQRDGLRAADAVTYNELGNIAREERDPRAARGWYLKSLTIAEKQGDRHAAAFTYANLGALADDQGNLLDAGRWVVRSIKAFLETDDHHEAKGQIDNFLRFYRRASPADKQKLEAIWRDANLGPFPTEPNE
jgi:tetratricopeptide (TPR) repeat protein